MPEAENTTGRELQSDQEAFRAVVEPVIWPAAFFRNCLSQLSYCACFTGREDDRIYVAGRLPRFVNQHHQSTAAQCQFDLGSSRYGKLPEPLKRANDFLTCDGRHSFASVYGLAPQEYKPAQIGQQRIELSFELGVYTRAADIVEVLMTGVMARVSTMTAIFLPRLKIDAARQAHLESSLPRR